MSNSENSVLSKNLGDDETIESLIAVVKKLRHELALCREAMDMNGGFDTAYSADARDAIIEADAVVGRLQSSS